MIEHVKNYIKSNEYNHFIIGYGVGLLIVSMAYLSGPFIILGCFAILCGYSLVRLNRGLLK